jgi:hypothetical protein
MLQRTFARWVRAGLAGVLVAVIYLASGAAHKVAWGVRHEEVLQTRSRLWYQEAFRVYGALPVAYLMGPSFAHFVGYRPPWTRLPGGPGDPATRERQYDETLLRQVAFGPSGSRWADSALIELGRRASDTDPDGRRMGIGALETLAKEYPDSPLIPIGLERLAALYEAAGRRADSENALRRLLETHPTTEAAAKLNEAIAAAAQQMARLNAADKSPDDIDRLRKIGAAQRRAREQLGALQVTGR